MDIKHNNIYKLIIQNYFQSDKNKIYEIPDLSDFNNYLNFDLLIRKNILNNLYDDNYNVQIFFYDLLKIRYICNSLKLSELYRYLNNPFKGNKDGIVNKKILYHFSNIQKIYFALVRFSYRCKIKIAKHVNDHDLLFNDYNSNDCFKLIQHDKIYTFSKTDIYNLFNNSIFNHDLLFFSSPKQLKNPYTQEKISKTELYNMYFFLKDNILLKNTYIIDTFFKFNFNLSSFTNNNDSILTSINIQKFIKNQPLNTLYFHIRKMIKFINTDIFHRDKKYISFDNRFPKKLYCNVFKPYLYYYLNYIHNSDNTVRHKCNIQLHKKIKRFYNNTPRFGRVINICQKTGIFNKTNNMKFKTTRKYVHKYFTDYIDFNKNDIIYTHIDRHNFNEYNFDINEIEEPSSDEESNNYDSDDDSVVISINDNNNNNINQDDNINQDNQLTLSIDQEDNEDSIIQC